MAIIAGLNLATIADKPKHTCVVRLSTSYWSNSKGTHTKKSLTYLRRLSEGYNILEEDCNSMGADMVVSRIINLYDCNDGVYEVIPCNTSTDYETGIVDDYDYKLIVRGA